jgi:hypothetical protein
LGYSKYVIKLTLRGIEMKVLNVNQLEEVSGGNPYVVSIALGIVSSAIYDGIEAMVKHVQSGGDGRRSCSGQMKRSCDLK